ncbi:MAG: glucose-6-phosphate isomerase, partial [Clostridia bacterium]|nr:glucose-6-phosphate isomerase [Clostridia bacterium]
MVLKLKDTYLSDVITEADYKSIEGDIKRAHDTLYAKNGPGNDFLGWQDLPVNYDKDEFARIQK